MGHATQKNALRKKVGLQLGLKYRLSWINVARAVLKHQGKDPSTVIAKGPARTIVLAFAGGLAKPLPSLRKPVVKSSYREASDVFFASDRWKKLRYQALKNCGSKCLCCGASGADGVVIHVDHVKPRYHFPELQWELSNLQVLCSDCNIGKGAWDETDWRTDPIREHMKSIKSE